ncbi:MAG: hypothetical protein II721_02205 [Bacilli bacterium]|nr:hypothetical protein [Bacilli bacterium]
MDRKIDLLFLGDSLIRRGDWEGSFPNESVYNAGIDGDTTTGLLSRIERLSFLKPTYVFILIGMNNLNTAINDYEAIIDKVRKIFSKSSIYYLSVTPTCLNEYYLNDDIDKCNDFLVHLCLRKEVNYINIHDALLEFGGGLKRELTTDGVHLSYKAYEIISAVIKEQLKLD